MIHDVLDLAHWKELFLREVIQMLTAEELQRERLDLTSPFQLVINERLREKAGIFNCSHRSLPTDIFIFAEGEPLRRETTKIGGIPYLPANRHWPRLPSGKPLTFVAQFCFADSHDLTGELPGDVLLIFVESDEYGLDLNWADEAEMKRQIVFEWVSIGDFPLVTAAMIPKTKWKPFPCYGAIFRAYDYPDLDKFAYPETANYIPTINSATKIGGVPEWIQYEELLPGRFLCELNSTMAEGVLPYPFLNRSAPLDKTWSKQRTGEFGKTDLLHWGDVGTLYLFIDDEGQIHWTIQST
jgi:hypothetical protein